MVEGELKKEKNERKKKSKNNLFRTKINGLSDCFLKLKMTLRRLRSQTAVRYWSEDDG